MDERPTEDNENIQPEGERNKYQQQTYTLHNTVGLFFMTILAMTLLVALLRQQRRYQELVVRWAQQNK